MTDTDYESALTTFLLSIADDEFVMGHRLTDWVTQAPTFEGDNTLASLAQDEMGHARLWYEAILDRDLAIPQELTPSVDDTIYDVTDLGMNRVPAARRNTILVEPKNVDVQRAELRHSALRGEGGELRQPDDEAIKYESMIAISAVYQDAEGLLLEAVRNGNDNDLVGRAEAALNEESFHTEHVEMWLDRLVSTDEGQQRLENAFAKHLSAAADLFAFPDEIVDPLVDDGILARTPTDLHEEWVEDVHDRLLGRPLDIDDALTAISEPPKVNGRRGEHTDDLDQLIEEIHAGEAGLAGEHPVTRYEV